MGHIKLRAPFDIYIYIMISSINSILYLSNKYNLPSDVSKCIFIHLQNDAATIIINKWYKHIFLHNSLLINLINKLNIKRGYDHFTETIFYYYDLYEEHNFKILKYCFKKINISICDKLWWINNPINFLRNGSYFVDETNSNNNTILKNYYECISLIYYKKLIY